MTEEKFTSGPWFAGDICLCDPGENPGVTDDHGNVVADCCRHTSLPLQQRVANANLIAAAPDLLEACRKASGHLDGTRSDSEAHNDLLACRKAIAKATNTPEQ